MPIIRPLLPSVELVEQAGKSCRVGILLQAQARSVTSSTMLRMTCCLTARMLAGCMEKWPQTGGQQQAGQPGVAVPFRRTPPQALPALAPL